MGTRRLLIALPVLFLVVLLQSAFWVPNHEDQTRGNPARLVTYVEAGIGDAKRLNPVLITDDASNRISLRVFDTLLDVDEEMRLVGELAERWESTEEAYVAALPAGRLPDGAPATAAGIERAIRGALAGSALQDLREVVTALEVVPAQTRTLEESVTIEGGGTPRVEQVKVTLRVPERVKMVLTRVVPDLFERLRPALGPAFFQGNPLAAAVEVANPAQRKLLEPRFAELLPALQHKPVITFQLRRGVKFHDGHPFGARDVRFTYEALMDPKTASPRTSSFEPIDEVQTPDDHTVRVVYKRLYGPAIYAWADIGILPEHLQNEAALQAEAARRGLPEERRKAFSMRDSEFTRRPVGTGPFRFAEWKTEQYIHLTRNDHYWNGPAEYRDLYIRVIPDYVTQELEFKAGALDWYDVQPHQVARYRDDDRYRAVTFVEQTYSYIGYNLSNPLFQDRRVRTALGMAINVEQIVKHSLYGQGSRMTGPYYSVTPYFNPDVKPLPYDPEGALRLLAEAGWKRNARGMLEKDGKPFAFKLITNHGNPQRRAIITIAQNAWRKLGIRVETQVFEWTVFLEDFIVPRKFDAMVLGWVGGGINPDMYQIWHSSQTNTNQLNRVGYQSAEADRLIEQIRLEYDPERQTALARELHAVVARDQPYTFLVERRRTWALDKKLVMVERGPDGEQHLPIRAPKADDPRFFITKWRKLETAPQMARD